MDQPVDQSRGCSNCLLTYRSKKHVVISNPEHTWKSKQRVVLPFYLPCAAKTHTSVQPRLIGRIWIYRQAMYSQFGFICLVASNLSGKLVFLARGYKEWRARWSISLLAQTFFWASNARFQSDQMRQGRVKRLSPTSKLAAQKDSTRYFWHFTPRTHSA